MPGMFETMRRPTACGTDNRALLLGWCGIHDPLSFGGRLWMTEKQFCWQFGHASLF
jgi:hypothetical protein